MAKIRGGAARQGVSGKILLLKMDGGSGGRRKIALVAVGVCAIVGAWLFIHRLSADKAQDIDDLPPLPSEKGTTSSPSTSPDGDVGKGGKSGGGAGGGAKTDSEKGAAKEPDDDAAALKGKGGGKSKSKGIVSDEKLRLTAILEEEDRKGKELFKQQKYLEAADGEWFRCVRRLRARHAVMCQCLSVKKVKNSKKYIWARTCLALFSAACALLVIVLLV